MKERRIKYERSSYVRAQKLTDYFDPRGEKWVYPYPPFSLLGRVFLQLMVNALRSMNGWMDG